MAIDYQQILMDMNRPTRRQGGGLKKLILFGFLFLILGGGAYAIWHFGVLGSAYARSSEFVGGLIARYTGDSEAAEPAAPGGYELDVALANQAAAAPVSRPAASSLRPVASSVVPVPAPAGPINIATELTAAPAARPSAAPAVPAPEPRPALRPSAQPAQQPAVVSAPQSAGPAMNPVPVLSEVKARIKVIDQMLATNPAEAMRQVEDLLKTELSDEDAAEAGYRMGYAARMLRDEAKAETSWKETAEKWPDYRGGRFSALALADTWYRRYATDRAQTSYWDDIQKLYSRVIGTDDAPFLPEQVKAKVKANLNNLNDSLFFGSAPCKLARYHKVESGELLGTIANRYRVDYESIARINGINPNRIRVGMDLKLVVGDVSIIVRKHSNEPDKTPTLTWYLDGRWVREYPTCVGEGVKTPGGNYELSSKERDPSWTNPANGQLLPNDHPENILGSRWMAMKGMNTQGLGIHGTTVDDSIPGYTSAGCIRLLNRDVEELFSYARIGAKVTVIE